MFPVTYNFIIVTVGSIVLVFVFVFIQNVYMDMIGNMSERGK